ncbi:MAG: hypothetical protein FJ202_00045 [Gemmatimonadetes bacterium]|nr:hypothetical protein [Gemmatimonadota bacterium]
MMHDNLDPNVAGHIEPAAERTARRDDLEIAGDREVPVAAATMPEVVHAWLDGEPVNETALQAASGYRLWNQVQAETARRRRMSTPTPVAGAIMEAIRKDA